MSSKNELEDSQLEFDIQVWELRKNGLDARRIARHLGYKNHRQVQRSITRTLKSIRVLHVEEYRKLELERLDEIWKEAYTAVRDVPEPKPEEFHKPALYEKTRARWEKRRLEALSLLLSISDRRSKLLGLERQHIEITATQKTDTGHFDPSTLTDDQLRALIAPVEEERIKEVREIKIPFRGKKGKK